MKKIILLLFFISTSFVSAQTFVCGNGDEPVNNSTNTPPPNFSYDADAKYVLNVKFHIVYASNNEIAYPIIFNGQQITQFGENEIMEIQKI